MRLADRSHPTRRTHPLDVVEQSLSARQWMFDRHGDDELAAQVRGEWCDFSLYFSWNAEASALHFSCAFDMRVAPGRQRPVFELLALINERLWIGHFGLWTEEGLPMFRYSLPLRGAAGLGRDQLEDLVETAITECDRFYPAFQFVIWGGKTASEALAAAILETVGEA